MTLCLTCLLGLAPCNCWADFGGCMYGPALDEIFVSSLSFPSCDCKLSLRVWTQTVFRDIRLLKHRTLKLESLTGIFEHLNTNTNRLVYTYLRYDTYFRHNTSRRDARRTRRPTAHHWVDRDGGDGEDVCQISLSRWLEKVSYILFLTSHSSESSTLQD